jgi:hypothetical protein
LRKVFLIISGSFNFGSDAELTARQSSDFHPDRAEAGFHRINLAMQGIPAGFTALLTAKELLLG